MRKRNAYNANHSFILHRITAVLLCAVLLLLSVSACAIDPFDPARKASLELKWKAGDEIPAGAHFKIYRVASADEFAVFTPVAPFDTYPVQMNHLNNSEWGTLASTLAGYVEADQLKPTAEGNLDAQGKLQFKDLQTGLYLVTGSVFQGKKKFFTPEPVMISLPGRDENEKWIFDVSVQMKYTSTDRALTSRKVIKVWNDKGAERYRPAEIVVQLLCDGKVFEEVKLNRDNNWRYTWTDLDAGCSWQIVEKKVPKGYTVKTKKNKTTVTITNTRDGQDDPSPLPQTGMLWWPVPVLAVLGMIFFVIGFIKNRGEKHE